MNSLGLDSAVILFIALVLLIIFLIWLIRQYKESIVTIEKAIHGLIEELEEPFLGQDDMDAIFYGAELVQGKELNGVVEVISRCIKERKSLLKEELSKREQEWNSLKGIVFAEEASIEDVRVEIDNIERKQQERNREAEYYYDNYWIGP